MTREALHEPIDRIPENEIVAAQRVLERLASDVAFRAAMSAPPDDQPVTAGDAEAIAAAKHTSVQQLASEQLNSLIPKFHAGFPEAVLRVMHGPPHPTVADVAELDAARLAGRPAAQARDLF